jgi:hypothetical protein
MTTFVPPAMIEAAIVVQNVHTQTGVVATGTTILPADNTIPQITEGNEYMTAAITPTNAANKLLIAVSVCISTSSIGHVVAALFRDSVVNALAGAAQLPQGAGNMIQLTFTHVMTAGTTSPITFRVRAGASAAGTTTFNGFSGGGILGGVAASSIIITEIKA